ncbi:MAG: hypothetical protein ACFFDN_01040 [Candidatus Hodarchaeota archaeon]
MEFFRIEPKDNEYFVFFQNTQVYYSREKPNFFNDHNLEPLDFFNKADVLFAKHQIKVPENYPKHCYIEDSLSRKTYSFPQHDFLTCIYCCITIEEKFNIDTSKILRWELIKSNSRRGIIHACSMATITLYYLNNGYKVSIPFEKKNQYNPDLIINNLKSEIKTILSSDWTKDIDPETGFGKECSRGEDICYDLGTFIGKKNSGFKGILQSDLIFADLSEKSLGELLKDAFMYGFKDKIKFILPEPKKSRIIYFYRYFIYCKGYYLDFQPKLWNLINVASKISYIKSIIKFDIPRNGKMHKIELPPPPKFKDEK